VLERVITGGQTGADQAGWRAARAMGLETGGYMPAGFRTEAGNRPEFAELYGAKETGTRDYRERTYLNVGKSEAVLWFGAPLSPGGRLTLRLAKEYTGRVIPARTIVDAIAAREERPPWSTADWLAEHQVQVLMVAGNRESSSPGIGAWVDAYLSEVFRIIGEEGVG